MKEATVIVREDMYFPVLVNWLRWCCGLHCCVSYGPFRCGMVTVVGLWVGPAVASFWTGDGLKVFEPLIFHLLVDQGEVFLEIEL